MSDLKALIKQGEGISVEFKECRRTLNRNVYKTVCAFLNRCGGTLLLGIGDAGEVTGVGPNSVEQIKKDFVTAINNPQKINFIWKVTCALVSATLFFGKWHRIS